MAQGYGKDHGRIMRMMSAKKPWHERERPELCFKDSQEILISGQDEEPLGETIFKIL